MERKSNLNFMRQLFQWCWLMGVRELVQVILARFLPIIRWRWLVRYVLVFCRKGMDVCWTKQNGFLIMRVSLAVLNSSARDVIWHAERIDVPKMIRYTSVNYRLEPGLGIYITRNSWKSWLQGKPMRKANKYLRLWFVNISWLRVKYVSWLRFDSWAKNSWIHWNRPRIRMAWMGLKNSWN